MEINWMAKIEDFHFTNFLRILFLNSCGIREKSI